MSEELRDSDGMRLLFVEEVAKRRGVDVPTIRSYNSVARRNRRKGKRSQFDLPPAVKHVRRWVTRADGVKIVVNTPLWREDRIEEWLSHRRGPRGRVREEATG